MLEKCDELCACGDRISPGMQVEIKLAEQLGVPISYVSEEQLLGMGDCPFGDITYMAVTLLLTLYIRFLLLQCSHFTGKDAEPLGADGEAAGSGAAGEGGLHLLVQLLQPPFNIRYGTTRLLP